MSEVFFKALNMSITASYIVLAALAIRLVFKKAPKWINYVMWGMVGFRLVLPFSVKSIFSLIPRSEVAGDMLPILGGAGGVSNAVDNIDPVVTTLGASGESLGFIDIIPAVWIAGMVLIMLYGVVSYVVLRKKVKGSDRIEDNIFMSKRITAPFILGIIIPRIYLPSDVDENSIPHIVAHEKSHLKRKDHLIKPFGFILLSVYWFNPVIWIAYVLMCRDIEMACDEAVIRQLGEEQKKPYSEALLSCSIHRKTIAACPLAFGEIGVKERIKNVLSYKKPSLWIIVMAVVISVVLGIVFLTNPKDVKEAEFPVGTYEFSEVIYMTPVSSYYPFEDTNEIYEFDDRTFTIIDKTTGNRTREVSFNRPEEISYSNSEWKSLFQMDLEVPGLSSISRSSRSMWKLSEEYQIYMMDGAVWLARFAGDHIWSIYKLVPYEGNVTRQKERISDFWDPMTDLDDEASLDRVIRHQIYINNYDNYSKGDISTQSYTVLKKEESKNEVTLYLMAMYMEFAIKNGMLVETSGSHSPAVLTLEKGNGGGYGFVEYWNPMDGSGYISSLRSRFPAGFDEELWDTQKYVKNHILACYDSAVKQSGIDTETIIGALMDILCKSPQQMSNPFTYIHEHEAEYRQLIYFGDHTLRYCFSLFEEGGQNGLEGYLMALLCSDILGIPPVGENFGYATGQDWYDSYTASE